MFICLSEKIGRSHICIFSFLRKATYTFARKQNPLITSTTTIFRNMVVVLIIRGFWFPGKVYVASFSEIRSHIYANGQFSQKRIWTCIQETHGYPIFPEKCLIFLLSKKRLNTNFLEVLTSSNLKLLVTQK